MDILLISLGEGIQIRPNSIYGMLWLQTHFENDHWNALASSQVNLPKKDAETMFLDAEQAGLSLSYIPSLSLSSGL